jgi:hypothetical protein
MDNPENNIDSAFRERFNDAKDLSLDPNTTWHSVESGLGSAASAAVTQSVVGSAASKISLFKLAAVFVGSLLLAGVMKSDQDVTSQNSGFSETLHASLTSKMTSNNVKSDLESEPIINAESKFPLTSATPHLSIVSNSTGSNAPIDLESKTNLTANAIATIIPDSNDSDYEPKIALNIDKNFIGFKSFNAIAREAGIEKLELLALDQDNTSSIVNPDIVEPEIVAWNNNHMWFLRAGFRIGSGESNSFEIESEWKANPSFSFGYGFTLTDRSYITAELGWLKRSGNGIERTRSVDLNPLINSLAITIGQGTDDDLIIHESLVATRMDYIHFPVNYNHLFAENWTFSVGGFMDLLISAKNDGYLVYNNTEYQASITGRSELSSTEGLNKVRFGAMLGAERKIYQNLSAYGQLMVPLNSAIDSKSDYRIIDETNRLVDLKLGIAFRI